MWKGNLFKREMGLLALEASALLRCMSQGMETFPKEGSNGLASPRLFWKLFGPIGMYYISGRIHTIWVGSSTRLQSKNRVLIS